MNTSEAILVVDDEINILHALTRQLRGKYSVDTADSGKAALDKINQIDKPYVIVISDMNMPGMDGLELLKRIKKLSPETMRIMLTGNADQETAKNAVNEGEVFRFVTKPCPKSELVKVIESALVSYREYKNSNNKIKNIEEHLTLLTEELSITKTQDSTTSLPNRYSFEVQLKELFEATLNDSSEISLCYIDLDQFNIINGVCGHKAGDSLLKQIAGKIRENINGSDILSRIGGDEFALLLIDCSKENAWQRINIIKSAIDNMRFLWESKEYSISISVGITSNHDVGNAEEMFKLSDTCCAYAKLKGRDFIYVYHADDAGLLQHSKEIKWVNKINEALDQNRFQLYYQPIVPVINKNVHHHFEILVRMHDENGKLILPADFIPTVEKYNFSRKLDRWVINNLFLLLDNNPEYLDKLGLCSINLSGNTLADIELKDFIFDKFSSNNIPPEKICFEITETAAITNFNTALEFIKSIKELGCKFALDDFGSGLSSFAYLKMLPVDYLKIDGQFVKDMVDNNIDYQIVKSVNDIGHAMGMKIIAEYVENESILAALRRLRVDFAQGFGISKPQPLDDFSFQCLNDGIVNSNDMKNENT